MTSVSITEDLRHVRVFVSVMGDEETRRQALAGFRAASGYLRREVSTHLRMRHAPEFVFIYDDSIERGSAVLEMIEKLNLDICEDTHVSQKAEQRRTDGTWKKT